MTDTRRVMIPATIEEAVSHLDGLAALLTATEWERAAIVFAFTEPQQGRRTSSRTTGSPDSIEDFAARGIKGLKSDRTVRDHRKAWEAALADGLVEPTSPCGVYDLPTAEWSAYYPPGGTDYKKKSDEDRAVFDAAATEEDVAVGSVARVAASPRAVAAAIKADPKVLAEAQRAINQIWDRKDAERAKVEPKESPRQPEVDSLELLMKLRTAHKALADAIPLSQDVRGIATDKVVAAVQSETDWMRHAIDAILSGVNAGPIDEQLRALLDAEAER